MRSGGRLSSRIFISERERSFTILPSSLTAKKIAASSTALRIVNMLDQFTPAGRVEVWTPPSATQAGSGGSEDSSRGSDAAATEFSSDLRRAVLGNVTTLASVGTTEAAGTISTMEFLPRES